jgi:hypothetical protein
MADLDFFRRITYCPAGVGEKRGPLLCVHQAEELAGLRIVISVLPVIPMVRYAFQAERR